ncbi:MAG TPA: cytoplasmic protein [Tepidisphaeraceae bacterium]|jgi:hypothetical protein|nr:cytoplasmic protein [Tepidisphaeraceae bacterium]
MDAEDALELAHKRSFKNRDEILASAECGCFFCLAIFRPQDIREWLKETDGWESAFCPRCGIDAVMGSASGFPITKEFLESMQQRWFHENVGLPDDFFRQDADASPK